MQECLARALYALEMAWHPSFNIASGTCRLDYETEENRGLVGGRLQGGAASPVPPVGCVLCASF